MAKKNKYYVVWVGNNPGIYESWAETQVQIKGFPNARYKAFTSLEEAEEAFGQSAKGYISAKGASRPFRKAEPAMVEKVVWDSIAVDAACSGNPGKMEYRGVDTKTGMELFHQGPFDQGTNNIGEFLAIVHALARFEKMKDSTTPIYTDSKTAMAWVRNKKVNTNLKRSAKNEILFQLMERALSWLRTHSYKNPILKWETEDWGEIPADFGRK